ncbi:MAG: hypothetical protein HY788_20415 [Deltaproteobacteria bacterium]|nr:hypothetical protein [Deltaproteobacteria bacterium]
MGFPGLDEIFVFLSQVKPLTAWEALVVSSSAFQEFRIMDEVECVRELNSDRLLLRLYAERVLDGKRVLGESSLVLNPLDEFRSRVRRSIEMAALVKNEPFDLPGPGQHYSEVETHDPTMAANPFHHIATVRKRLEVKSRQEQVVLSSSEVWIEEKRRTFRNSLGIEAGYSETELFVDFVCLAKDGLGHESESHGCRKVRRLQDLDPDSMVARNARFARDTLSAEEPPTGEFDVVFSHESLDSLFNYFVAQSGGPAAYHGWSRFKNGEPVVSEVAGDRITLTSDPALPGGLKSLPFDDNGLSMRPVKVIENGLLCQRPVEKRYAQYLRLEPSGAFANVVIEPGATPFDSLFNPKPVLHCVRFSTFDPDPVSGAFSGEIRLGYWLTDSGVKPVKGGSVSGVMENAFRRATFSSETVQREAYHGPKGVKLCNLAVAGS